MPTSAVRDHYPSIVTQFDKRVVESQIDHKQWAIWRSLPGENPRCSAIIARNGRWGQCGQPIKENPNLSVPSPCFFGTSEVGYKKCFQSYWFCSNSSAGCASTEQVMHLKGGIPPELPRVWPVEFGTKLTQLEADVLGNKGFLLVENVSANIVSQATRNKAHFEFTKPVGQSPLDPRKRPLRRAGKRVHRRSVTDPGESRRQAGLDMITVVCMVDHNVDDSSYRFQLNTISSTMNKPVQYMITISENPACTCPFFLESVSHSKPGHFFRTCKHMYHVYNKVLGLPLDDERPHQATLSRAEVEDILRFWKPNVRA
ncbi:hypothetical protein M758_UG276900 [Ceratodon purpureus]|nr:hypothetical protein M758_UG276900 [Ceratodon purpureus]